MERLCDIHHSPDPLISTFNCSTRRTEVDHHLECLQLNCKTFRIRSRWVAGVSGNDFLTFGNGNGNGSTHSQTLGTGTGMKNCIPNFWEREREWKFHSQFLGTGTGMEIPFPNFGNGNEMLLFPGMTGNGNRKLSETFLYYHFLMRQQSHITDIVARIMIKEGTP